MRQISLKSTKEGEEIDSVQEMDIYILVRAKQMFNLWIGAKV